MKKIIFTIILFLTFYHINTANAVDLETAYKVSSEHKKVLHLPFKSENKRKSRYNKQINQYFRNLLTDIKDIILLNENDYKILKRKLSEQQKIIQSKGSIKKTKIIRPLNIIIKGKYKFIHQPYKEKIGESEGNQFLTQRERFYFSFSVDIINAKSKKIMTTIERSSHNENYFPALKQITKEIEKYLKPDKKSIYYYPLDINFSPAFFFPLKNFSKIANNGIGLSTQFNIQNYLFARSICGLNLDFYYIDSNASRIDSYFIYTLNLLFGYRIIFNNDFFISPQLGCGYLIHHINDKFYFDPLFTIQLELANLYKNNYYLFFTPAYNFIKEDDQQGRFTTIKIGIKYFIN